MNFPSSITTYCPKCKAHTEHKVKVSTYKAKRGRALAWGNRQHERQLTGYVGKVAGEKKVRKQGIRQKIMLECPQCKKKHERVIGTRTTKKMELKR